MLDDVKNFFEADAVKPNLPGKLKHIRKWGFTEMTDSALEEGLGAPDMDTLILRGGHFTEIAFARIAAFHPHLRTLLPGKTEKLTDARLELSLRSQPRLRELQLSPCPLITDQSPEALEILCPRHRSAHLVGNRINWQARAALQERRTLVNCSIC